MALDSRGAAVLKQLADKAKPAAWQSPNVGLRLAGIADGLTHGVNAAAERRVGNDPSAPDLLYDFVFANGAFPVRNQIGQQVKHLGLDMNPNAGSSQFATFDVKLAITETDDHVRPRSPQSGAMVART
jgi:hypothetical protein